jgi:beta-glucanase (GH16 family)
MSVPHVSGRETAKAVSALGTSFSDELDIFDTSRWQAAQWNNGGVFFNGWHPNQIAFAGGRMQITLEADLSGLTGLGAVSGEYRTWQTYGWGTYSARLKASRTPGTISALFTYTGPSDGTQHDEIDVEIKGDDPSKVSLNYWTNGVEHPTVINLGFDASLDFHDYAFRWSSGRLQWFVDGVLVHEETGSRGPLPQVAGKLMLNHWGATGAEPWSSSYVPSTTPSQMVVERVAFIADSAPVAATSVSVGALSGSAWAEGKGWHAVATINVRDAAGAAVPGAVVRGDFSVGGTALTCTTGSSGQCSITSASINKTKASTTFTVRGISGTNLSYSAAGNVAGSIVIVRP